MENRIIEISVSLKKKKKTFDDGLGLLATTWREGPTTVNNEGG